MSRFRLSSAAESDLQDAWLFVAQDSIESADKILDLIRAKIELVAAHPEIGESRPELPLPQFPKGDCGQLCNLLPRARRHDATTVDVVRIVHGARDFHELG